MRMVRRRQRTAACAAPMVGVAPIKPIIGNGEAIIAPSPMLSFLSRTVVDDDVIVATAVVELMAGLAEADGARSSASCFLRDRVFSCSAAKRR